MKKVLFVCLGNICRSPMAEGMLKALSKGDYLVDSAATSTLQIGNAPHPGTQEVLSELGITTEGMLARQITESDFYDFDFIIAMDHQNPEKTICLLVWCQNMSWYHVSPA